MCKAYDHKEVKKMKKYEVMFIVKPTLAEEDVNKVVEKYKKVYIIDGRER